MVFQTLSPAQPFVEGWPVQAIAYQLNRVARGEIRRLIVNMPHMIDLIEFIFHPMRRGRPLASLDGSRVE